MDANPFTGANVNVIDAGVAKGTTPYVAKVALANISNTLYVRQTDPSKRQSVKAITIDSKVSYSCDFRSVSGGSTSVVKSSSAPITKAPTREYASAYTKPADAITLSASDMSKGAGTYFVPQVLLGHQIVCGARNSYIFPVQWN